MKPLSAIACVVFVLRATSSVAAPIDDLSIRESGRLCNAEGQTGSRQIELINSNTSQGILATVRVDSDIHRYVYGDTSGARASFTYPFNRVIWLAARKSAILGCASVETTGGLANQVYSKVGGVYQSGSAPIREDPADFVGSITPMRPARCIESNPGLYLINRHPSRKVIVMVGLGGGEIGPVFIPPQGTSVSLGCKYDRPPGSIRISRIQFASGPE
jgi:hypothetical protein